MPPASQRSETSGAYRLGRIDTFRGVAVIMVVVFHVIGGTATSGLRVADDSTWRLIADVFVYTRMPLFAFISGFVYAARPVGAGQVTTFLRGKARRFLLPFLSVTILHQSLAHLTGSGFAIEPEHIYMIFIYGYAHLWYLQATLLIFVIVVLLESSGVARHKIGLVAALVVATAVSQVQAVQDIKLISIFKVSYLLPFFLLGLYVRRFDLYLSRSQMAFGAGILGFGTVLIIMRETGVFDSGLPVARESLPMLLFSALICGVLVSSKLEISWIAKIGEYAYPIYLFHFVQSGIRAGLLALGLTSDTILFVICTCVGLLAPIWFANWVVQVPVLKTLLLGMRPGKTGAMGGPPSAGPPT